MSNGGLQTISEDDLRARVELYQRRMNQVINEIHQSLLEGEVEVGIAERHDELLILRELTAHTHAELRSRYVVNRDQNGFIYVLRAQAGDFCKIGKTTSLSKRIAQLKIQLPFPVSVHAAYQIAQPARVESVLHEQFSDKRLNGEWFRLTESDLSRLSMMITESFLGKEVSL